jgi:hypothetical protein
MIVFEDVGELRRLERTLRQAQQIDSRTHRMAAAVRDLKTSVTEVLLHGVTLEARLSQSEAEAELAREMLLASHRAAALIDRMLTSLLHAGSDRPQPVQASPITHRRRMAFATGEETILLVARDTVARAARRAPREVAGYAVLEAATATAARAARPHHGPPIDLLFHETGSELPIAEIVDRARRLHPEMAILEWGSFSPAELLRAVRGSLGGEVVAI